MRVSTGGAEACLHGFRRRERFHDQDRRLVVLITVQA
jgi:hypothetical protein